MKTFIEKLEAGWGEKKFLCVNLDPRKLPASVIKNVSKEEAIFNFNKALIDATHDLVLAYKPQSAFYEAEGEEGYRALKKTVVYIKENYPAIPIILDAKRGDVDHTNESYAQAIFDILGVDAVTVHPYMGMSTLQPFFDRADKGVIVLVKTSNMGSGEFQDLLIEGEPLYIHVAKKARESNKDGNIGVVVGATYPKELAAIRAIIGDMPILIPGIGAQGGDIAETVRAGKNSKGIGMIIAAGPSVIYASAGGDFAEAARKETEKLTEEIRKNL